LNDIVYKAKHSQHGIGFPIQHHPHQTPVFAPAVVHDVASSHSAITRINSNQMGTLGKVGTTFAKAPLLVDAQTALQDRFN
jgi:hypothetical protein